MEEKTYCNTSSPSCISPRQWPRFGMQGRSLVGKCINGTIGTGSGSLTQGNGFTPMPLHFIGVAIVGFRHFHGSLPIYSAGGMTQTDTDGSRNRRTRVYELKFMRLFSNETRGV